MTTRTTFGINGLNCGGCVNTLTKKLTAVEGVESLDVDLTSGGTSIVSICYDEPLDAGKVRQALITAGYTLSDHLSAQI